MAKYRLWITVMLVFSLSLGACDYAHSGIYKIVVPDPGQVFQMGEPVKIFVRLPGSPSSRYAVFLDGRRLIDATVPSNHDENSPIEYIYVLTAAQSWAGYHRVDARFRFQNDPEWRADNSVCFFIQDSGANSVVPGGLSDCNVSEDVISRAYPLEAATATFTLVPTNTSTPTATATSTSTATLIPYVPPEERERRTGCSGLNMNACNLSPNCYWSFAANRCLNN